MENEISSARITGNPLIVIMETSDALLVQTTGATHFTTSVSRQHMAGQVATVIKLVEIPLPLPMAPVYLVNNPGEKTAE